MGDDLIRRQEHDGYIRRHEAVTVAHSVMRHSLVNQINATTISQGMRLDALERWQQRIIGGMMFAAFILGGGGVAAVVELLRK